MTAPPRSTKQGIAGIESIGRVYGGAAQWHDPHVSQPGVERASLCLPRIHPMRRAAPSSLSLSQTCLPLLCCALQAVPRAARRDLPCWLLVGEGGWAERARVAHRAAALQEPDTVCSRVKVTCSCTSGGDWAGDEWGCWWAAASSGQSRTSGRARICSVGAGTQVKGGAVGPQPPHRKLHVPRAHRRGCARPPGPLVPAASQ